MKRFVLRFHRDRRGVVSVFIVMLALPLLTLVGVNLNTGRVLEVRLRTQTAADAAGRSAAVWIARGMNLLAVANRAMPEAAAASVLVNAAPPTHRQAVDRLNALRQNAPPAMLQQIDFELRRLQSFIIAANAARSAPLEQYLGELSRFQETVVRDFPNYAKKAAADYALEHDATGVLFPFEPQMPVEKIRFAMNEAQVAGVEAAKAGPIARQLGRLTLSQAANFFAANRADGRARAMRAFGNLPCYIPLPPVDGGGNPEKRYFYLAFAYRRYGQPALPGIFKNNPPDAMAYAQAQVFHRVGYDGRVAAWDVKLVTGHRLHEALARIGESRNAQITAKGNEAVKSFLFTFPPLH